MSWHTGGSVPAHEDYRDREIVKSIIQKGERGVMVMGPSRIGKTSLLRRIQETLKEDLVVRELIDMRDGPKSVFSGMEKAGSWLLFDEAQDLLVPRDDAGQDHWTDRALDELRQLLKGRAFVMTAWPILGRSQRPKGLERLLDDVADEKLGPLSRDETRRMIRRALSDEPKSCVEEAVDGIFRATAGFPHLVARLCRFLTTDGKEPFRFPSEEELSRFMRYLGDDSTPFRDLYNSLPPRMQEVLEAHARGTQVSLDELLDVGMASGSPAAFSASLFSRVWSPGGSWEPRSSARRGRQMPQPTAGWLHVSDLHFGAGSQAHRFNQEAVLEAIRRDVEKNRPFTPDFIFVTGDIAFSAKPEQYKNASTWLRQLAEAAGVSPETLRLVPGNHDVDREKAKVASNIHEVARARPANLDDRLSEEENRSLLLKKLDAYVQFVKRLVPKHPKGNERLPLDWSEPLAPEPRRPGRLWIAGLCSVWVSDAGDAERKLLVGERQLRVLNPVQEEDLLLLLTHHPPGWLHPDSEELLLSRMAERAPHIHLCGHVHVATARALRGLGKTRDSLRLVAGASHGESSEEHGYAWGALRWNKGSWELGWAPRVFTRSEGMVADRNRYKLDDEGFAWEPLPRLKWSAPDLQVA